MLLSFSKRLLIATRVMLLANVAARIFLFRRMPNAPKKHQWLCLLAKLIWLCTNNKLKAYIYYTAFVMASGLGGLALSDAFPRWGGWIAAIVFCAWLSGLAAAKAARADQVRRDRFFWDDAQNENS